MRLSVIIPTLNEATALPRLLAALAAQSEPPAEIIVADAGSTDGTDRLALEHGARLVPGGKPARGRNAGAAAASGQRLLFLDADVAPPADFLATFTAAAAAQELAVATCLVAPLDDRISDRLVADATNLYLLVVQVFSPHAPGFCILADAGVHAAIGGFDESLAMAEDHDYVQRAARVARFGVVGDVALPVSMRRLEKEGLSALAFKYLWCEMHALAGRPIRALPFAYEFGTHTAAPAARRFVDIAALRREMEDKVANPIEVLTGNGLRRLEAQVQAEVASTREALAALEPPDLAALRRYVERRRTLLRITRRQARARLAALQSAPAGEWLDILVGQKRPPPEV